MKMKLKRQRPPLKTHGGKYYLSTWLIDNFPKGVEGMTYIEPFVGGASLLLNKPISVHEQANDLDLGLSCFWRTLQNNPDKFIEEVSSWSYSKESFQKAIEMKPELEFDRAVKEYVLRRMSRGGMKKAFAWSERLRGGKPGDQNAWDTMILQLPTIHERIKKVEFFNTDALIFIPGAITAMNAFVYLDPPYVKGTRHKGSVNVYDHEMTDKQHEKLLDTCLTSGAKIMISGYQCPLYTSKLKNWKFKFKPIANHSSQSERKGVKLECLWCNY
jgi:DNA adenine methylase